MPTIDIRVDSILILALTTQLYAKTQPKFDVFDEWFLMLEAVLDSQSDTKRLTSISSYILMLYLKIFWIKADRPRSPFFHEQR